MTREPAGALKVLLRRTWYTPPETPVEDPHKWRNLIATSGLGGRASEKAWSRLFFGASRAADLCSRRFGRAGSWADHEESNRLLGQLWWGVKAFGGVKNFSDRSDPSVYIRRGRRAFQLAGAVTAESAENSEFGRSSSFRAAELGLTLEECDSAGPGASLRKVAGNACSLGQVNQFPQAASQLNLLKNCDSSLRAAASGMRRWAFSCDLAGRPRFPPTEEGALAWSSIFVVDRSLQIFVAHLEEACLLFGVSIAWESKAVPASSYGLATAGDRSRGPRPAGSKDQMIQLISTNGWLNELSILAFPSWIFPPRAPSECSPLRRQRTGEDLGSDDRPDRKAAIGLSEGKLVIKLNGGKHMARGFKPIRACIYEEYALNALELRAPRLLCPVCQMWPAVRQPAWESQSWEGGADRGVWARTHP